MSSLAQPQPGLVAIREDGSLNMPFKAELPPPQVTEVVNATTQLYRKVGYQPPWIGYLALEEGTLVGACGFKSPPVNGRVEIAYFTFPPHESRGLATRMAADLIRLAREKMPEVTVTARTLPEENASTSVLKKLGFSLLGPVEDPEDGLVWEWQLNKQNVSVGRKQGPR